MSRQSLPLLKSLNLSSHQLFRSLKLMAQFCYLRQCKGAKHFCRLLLYGWQGWTWSRGLKLEKVGPIIQLFMSTGIEWSRICGTVRLRFYNSRLRLRRKIT